MEIERLRLLLSETDLMDLARRHIPPDLPIEDLDIRVLAEGVRVKASYQVFLPVSFETLWELGVDAGKPTARLAQFKTMGMPGNVLKSLIMNLIADAAKKEAWLSIRGDVVSADVAALCAEHGLKATTNLTSIRTEDQRIVVEGGVANG